VEPNKESKQTKVKLEFSEFSLKDETKKVLKLTLTSGSENKEVELELSADKKSATTKELVDFSTKTYKVSKLTLNDVEVNVDSVKNNDLKIAESTPTTKEDKAVVSKIELVEPNKESKQTKVKLEFSEFSLKDETKKVLKLTLTSGSENKEVELELSADKKSATTKELVDFSTKTYKVSKLTLNDVEVNVDSVKNNDLKIAESTPTTKEDKAVVSKIELVEPNKESKQTKVKLEFSEFSLKDETKKVLKLTLTSGSENKEVELELSADKKSATTKELVDFSTKTYKVSKLTLNDVEVNVDSVKNNDLKIAESTPTTKEDKAVVSKIELVEPNKESKQTKVKLEFSEFSL
ncbi:DUF1410 domain-containing protein, partial [Ureaplasma parvum]